MQKEYVYLFNKISKLIEELDVIKLELMQAQVHAEELYMERGD